jgi:hypothetical protein
LFYNDDLDDEFLFVYQHEEKRKLKNIKMKGAEEEEDVTSPNSITVSVDGKNSYG